MWEDFSKKHKKMTMYKPGTQLIITDLWAAAAAHKLGFEVETFEREVFDFTGKLKTPTRWLQFFERYNHKWRVTVTESGPNAAERFLPKEGDLAFCVETSSPLEIPEGPGIFQALAKMTGLIPVLYRNGIPFPQFSEVIEP